jgi:predicted nucleic acid-binding Zn ribbon protein
MASAKRPPGRKSRLTPLSESLGLSLSRGFLNFTAQKLRVFEIWPRVVGSEAAARTRPEALQHGRLTVLVPGPAWLDRYTYEKSEWLARLNRELADQALLEDIILKIGEF